jgi:hypothetical protein
MDTNWKHIKTIVDGELCKIEGLNIWDYEWKNTDERVSVKDPLYGQDHTLTVFEISDQNTTVTFAAGEFSNCVWGIYQRS